MTKERIKYFDALKLFAIFMVLWGHAVQQFSCDGGSGYGNAVFRAIYAFHMPLFMGIVGYFAASLSKLNFKEMLTKKFRQLILPALAFGLMYSLSEKYMMGGGRWLSGWGWFWFLKSAFVCCILYWVGTRWEKHRLAGLALTVLASFFYGELVSYVPTITGSELISAWHVPKLYLCFVIGALLKTYKDEIVRYEGRILALVALIWIPMWILMIVDEKYHFSAWHVPKLYLCFVIGALLKTYKDEIVRYEGRILALVALIWIPMWILMIVDEKYHFFPYTQMLLHGTALFGLLEASLSVVFFILLFKMLSRHVPSTRWGEKMCKWGGMTLSIYCMQVFILETYMPACLDFKWMNQWVFDLVAAPLLSAGVLLVCVALTKLIQQSRWLSWLFLGKELGRKKKSGDCMISAS